MEPNRIKIWQFTKAPRELRSLHDRPGLFEWLALIPAPMWGSDLEDAIRERAEPGSLSRHQTLNGDFVYVGRSRGTRVL